MKQNCNKQARQCSNQNIPCPADADRTLNKRKDALLLTSMILSASGSFKVDSSNDPTLHEQLHHTVCLEVTTHNNRRHTIHSSHSSYHHISQTTWGGSSRGWYVNLILLLLLDAIEPSLLPRCYHYSIGSGISGIERVVYVTSATTLSSTSYLPPTFNDFLLLAHSPYSQLRGCARCR